MANTETINVLSLCSGYGGLELGLSGALEGVFRVVAVEIEAYALANLAAKAQEGKLAVEVMWPDLKTFPAERFRGCFDIITAGYPCQPFSIAGKRLGENDLRHLWPDIARIIKAVRPVWCIFENVPGHLSIGFAEVYCCLRDMGYKVEAGLFTAAEVGAPHKRQRLFILANAIGRTMSSRPAQEKSDLQKRPILSKKPYQQSGIRGNIRSGFRTLWPPRPEKVSTIPRMDDGDKKELDRLRLLGNGVMPQQAEKAIKTLMGLFE